MNHERSTFWGAGALRPASGQARSRFGAAGRGEKGRQRCPEPCRRAAVLQRVLLAAVLLWLTLANHALAAGVVGTGTPESCTEAALDAALAGGGT